MSPWKEIYGLYRRLEPRWVEFYQDRSDMTLRVLQDFARCGWDEIDARLLPWIKRPTGTLRADIKRLGEMLERTGDRYLAKVRLGSEEPLDDVYHAAMYVALKDYPWLTKRSAFRGQRRPWRVQPSLFVPRPADVPLGEAGFDARLRRLARFVDDLGRAPQFAGRIKTVPERIAAAQHYEIPTWLVDVTSDALIALFFASLNGQPGDTGVLMRFCMGEWADFSVGGTNRVGALREVGAPEIRRLRVQKAFFLEGSHPEIVEQYVGFNLCFRQQAALVFEDPTRGITRSALLDDASDPLTAFVAAFMARPEPAPGVPAPPLPNQPAFTAMSPLSADDYRAIAESWLRGPLAGLVEGRSLTSDTERILGKLCEFHSRLQRRRDEIDIVARGLRRFSSAIDHVAMRIHREKQAELSFRDIVSNYYLTHALGDDVATVGRVRDEVA